MSDEILCATCRKTISDDDLAADGVLTWSFNPGNECLPERSELRHSICYQRAALEERAGVILEFENGWVPLVTRLMDAIDAVGLDYKVDQIKEKFGGLRFYWHPKSQDDDGSIPEGREGAVDQIEVLVAAAEDESLTTCEVCGEPGRTRRGSYVRTLCDTHDGGVATHEG